MEEVLNNTLQKRLEYVQKQADKRWDECVELEEQLEKVRAENRTLLKIKSSFERKTKSQEAHINWLENEISNPRGLIRNKDNASGTAELDLERVKMLQNPQSALIPQQQIMKDRNTDAKCREQASADELIKRTYQGQDGVSDELEAREEYGQEQENLNTQLKQENEYLKEKLAILQTFYNTTTTYEAATSDSHPLSIGDGKHQSLLDEVGRLSDFDEDSIIAGEYNSTVTVHPGSIDTTPFLIKSATVVEDIRGISPNQETIINTGIKSLLSACHVAPPTSRPMKEGFETIKAHLKEQKSRDTWHIGELRELEQQKELSKDRSVVLHRNITKVQADINIEDLQKSDETHESQSIQCLTSAENSAASEPQFAKATLMAISKEHSDLNEAGNFNRLCESIVVSDYWLNLEENREGLGMFPRGLSGEVTQTL